MLMKYGQICDYVLEIIRGDLLSTDTETMAKLYIFNFCSNFYKFYIQEE